MADPTDDELDALLSRGRLARPQREAMLRNVLAQTQPARKKAFAWPWAVGFAFSAAALVLVVRTPENDFAAKGALGAGVTIEAVCQDTPCQSVALSVTGASRPAFVTGYAISPSGQRAWLNAQAIVARPETQVLAVSASLPSPGEWTLRLFVAEHALSREDMLASPAHRELKVQVQP